MLLPLLNSEVYKRDVRSLLGFFDTFPCHSLSGMHPKLPGMPWSCHGSNGSMPLRQVPFSYRLPSWTARSAFSGVEDDVSKAFVSRLQKTKNGVTLSFFFFFWPPTSICTVYNHIHIIYISYTYVSYTYVSYTYVSYTYHIYIYIFIYIYFSCGKHNEKTASRCFYGLRRPPYLVTIDG